MNQKEVERFLKNYRMASYEIVEAMNEKERCAYLISFSGHLYAMNKRQSDYFKYQPLVDRQVLLSYLKEESDKVNPILAKAIRGYYEEKEKPLFLSDQEVYDRRLLSHTKRILAWMKEGENSPIPPFDLIDASFLLKHHSAKKANCILGAVYPRKENLAFYRTLNQYGQIKYDGHRMTREELLSKRHLVMVNGEAKERFTREEREEFVNLLSDYHLPNNDVFLSLIEKRVLAEESFSLIQSGDISLEKVNDLQAKRIVTPSQIEHYAMGYYYAYATPLEQEEFRMMAKMTPPSEEFSLLFPKLTNWMQSFKEDTKKPFCKK